MKELQKRGAQQVLEAEKFLHVTEDGYHLTVGSLQQRRVVDGGGRDLMKGLDVPYSLRKQEQDGRWS